MNLIHPQSGSGSNKKSNNLICANKLNITDIYHFVVTIILSLVMTHASGYSVSAFVFSISCLASSMIDIIYSNSVKSETILFDNIMLTFHTLATISTLASGEGITHAMMGACLSRFIFDKKIKRDSIFESQKKTE
jgi:hypothetical protein